MPVRERASTRVWKGGREAVVIGAGGGSPEVEGLEGGEGGERRGQRRAAFGADVVEAATKRGKGGGEEGGGVSEKRRRRGRGHDSGGESAGVWVGRVSTSAGDVHSGLEKGGGGGIGGRARWHAKE